VTTATISYLAVATYLLPVKEVKDLHPEFHELVSMQFVQQMNQGIN
jgi:hypothetical protein